MRRDASHRCLGQVATILEPRSRGYSRNRRSAERCWLRTEQRTKRTKTVSSGGQLHGCQRVDVAYGSLAPVGRQHRILLAFRQCLRSFKRPVAVPHANCVYRADRIVEDAHKLLRLRQRTRSLRSVARCRPSLSSRHATPSRTPSAIHTACRFRSHVCHHRHLRPRPAPGTPGRSRRASTTASHREAGALAVLLESIPERRRHGRSLRLGPRTDPRPRKCELHSRPVQPRLRRCSRRGRRGRGPRDRGDLRCSRGSSRGNTGETQRGWVHRPLSFVLVGLVAGTGFEPVTSGL
jgi:hypothetical protein